MSTTYISPKANSICNIALDGTRQPPSSNADRDLPVRRNPSVTSSFDIVAAYHRLLSTHPAYTQPVAAIQALIELLNAQPTSTVMETLDLINTHVSTLRSSVRNPVPLTAGTDLFERFIVQSLRHQDDPSRSFAATRDHLLSNSAVFATRAIQARESVANAGWRLVKDDSTVLTFGASRAVSALLSRAAAEALARSGRVTFRVIFVRDVRRAPESDAVVARLRGSGIPVAEIPETAVAHVMGLQRRVGVVLVGAEAVPQSGGIFSRLGTAQIAKLAYAHTPRIPFYVATEEHKFVRMATLPTGQTDKDLGFAQGLLDFSEERPSRLPQDPIDYTPPEWITNLVTESGIHKPEYPFLQLMDAYGTMVPDRILTKALMDLEEEGMLEADA
ncbi:related to translation initiation factor eIF-2B alpha subunit [Cephalotrichum gorgonifer]|uniref:Translation initiation factor eIF2B subunit alpha n=1 Tax=Cephalotrichum gorgonifer TaxID=2041049 RepID=A0AAE8N583_9PEZI|nr:related to translation initiation factor eIF-2B alpha subunit [Cephalotrichum gorgonifer]